MDIEALRAAATDVVEGILTHDDTLALLPDHLVRSVPSKEEVLKVLESFEHDRSNDQVRLTHDPDSSLGCHNLSNAYRHCTKISLWQSSIFEMFRLSNLCSRQAMQLCASRVAWPSFCCLQKRSRNNLYLLKVVPSCSFTKTYIFT